MKKSIVFASLGIMFLSAGTLSTLSTSAQEQHTHTSEIISNQAYVSNFSELKAALAEDNGITTIRLTEDISLDSGIKIHPSKQHVTIDGQNHQLTEQSLGVHGTIYVDSNSSTTEVNVVNLSIMGKNYYGPVNVDNSLKGVVLNYTNVNYNGPQLVHNVKGFANFYGNTTINIEKVLDGSNVAQEVAEVMGVTINDNFKVTHNGQTDSAFWMGTSSDVQPYFIINDNAKVSMDIKNNTLFYIDNSAKRPLDMTVGKNATFEVNTIRELFRLGNAGNILLKSNSKTIINRSTDTTKTPTIQLSGSVKPEKGAILNIIHAPETTAPTMSGV